MSLDVENLLPPGTMLGRYRLERGIGAGAMGAVYLATHTGLGKSVVVKVLHPQFAQSARTRMRFMREGEAAARIRHPHVIDITDRGEEGTTPYLVMEYLEGESLGTKLHREGALPLAEAVDLMLPVIAAVDAAHAVGVVHRDLKPDNVFVTHTPRGDVHPKVLDFGISRVVDDEAHRTGTAAMLGSPAYMAPEQIERARDADARSDQYALGVVLYECLTGRRCFEADNVYAVLKAVGEGRVTLPRAVRPELPAEVEAIVLRAMAHGPTARFPTLRAFGAALLPFGSERAQREWMRTFEGHAVPPLVVPPPIEVATVPTPISDTLEEAARSHDIPPKASASRPLDARVVAVAAAVFLLVAGLTVALLRPTARSPETMAATVPPTAPTQAMAVTPPVPAPPPVPVALPVPAVQPPAPTPPEPAAQPTPVAVAARPAVRSTARSTTRPTTVRRPGTGATRTSQRAPDDDPLARINVGN